MTFSLRPQNGRRIQYETLLRRTSTQRYAGLLRDRHLGQFETLTPQSSSGRQFFLADSPFWDLEILAQADSVVPHFPVTKQDIEKHFEPHGTGKITEIKLMNGFGFLEYEDAMDARDVVPGENIDSSR